MRNKKLLAAFLLGVGLCFVPALGYGEVDQKMLMSTVRLMDFWLLKASVHYIMTNPTRFLSIGFFYDPDGGYGRFAGFPEDIDTKGKICVLIEDNRGVFSSKSEKALLNQFKKELETIYSFIESVATDMDIDIVALFSRGKYTPLGYFYRGEYHLEKKE